MEKRTRTILFFAILLMFLAAAPVTILYTQGYRFDFGERKIVQTGGILVKAVPSGAEVYLDGKLKKKTDFLFGQAFLGNLLPDVYRVRVSKEGYFPWEKELEVKERQLTQAQHIFLIPQDPNWNIVEENVERIWFSPRGTRMAMELKTDSESLLEIRNLENGETLASIPKEKMFAGKEIVDIRWSQDEKRLLLKTTPPSTGGGGGIPQFFLVQETGAFQRVAFPTKNLKKVWFHPISQEKLLLLYGEGGGLFGLSEYTIGQPKTIAVLGGIRAVEPRNDGLFWITQEGHLAFGDFSGVIKNILTREPISLQNGSTLTLFVPRSGNNLFLRRKEALLSLNQAQGRFEKIADSFGELAFAPDLKKAAYFTPYEIWISYLDAQTDQPQKEAGTNTFLTRIGERITALRWLSSRYLLFRTDSKIKIAEIDDRDGINIMEIPTPAIVEEVSFSAASKKLYLFSEKTIFISEKKFAP